VQKTEMENAGSGAGKQKPELVGGGD